MEILVGDYRFGVRIEQHCVSSFGITVNKGHMGYLVHYSTGWTWYPSSPKVNLYSDDIFIILDMIREAFPKLEIFQTADHFCEYMLPEYKSWV